MKELQKVAEFLRNVAYSDDRLNNKFLPRIGWSIGVVHPRNNKGNMTFACGIWTDTGRDDKRFRSSSFDYEMNGKGLYDFKRWTNDGEIYFPMGRFTFEQLEDAIIKLFGVEKLFNPQ